MIFVVKNVYVVIIILIMALSLVFLLFSKKRSKVTGACYFCLLVLAATAYNFTYIFELSATSELTAKFWFYAKYNTLSFIHFSWIMMSIVYVGSPKKHIMVAKYVMLLITVGYQILLNTDQSHHLFFRSITYQANGLFAVIVFERGFIYLSSLFTAFVLWIISISLYLNKLILSTKQHKPGFLIMIIASVIPAIPIYLNVTHSGYLGLDYVPLFSAVCALVYFFGVFYYNMFLTKPIAIDSVFRLSKAGILLADYSDRIIDLNDAFVSVYPDYKVIVENMTLASFFEAHSEYGAAFQETKRTQFHLERNDERRYYSAELHYINSNEIVIGKMLSLDDVTELVQNQLKLKELAEAAENKAEFNEMSFLHAQIRPHFLNNTLSVINSMISRNPDSARELVVSLSEFLRNSYFFDSAITNMPLKNELEVVQTFVDIQQARFEERLIYVLDCDAVPDIIIPRFLLQPLVENAIKHGVLKKIEGGTVTLRIFRQDGKACFEISDDGVGISHEKIEAVLSGTIQKQGIGLLNIHKRLLKHYGEGLCIESIEGQGTTVSFSINEQEAHILSY